MCVNDCIEMIIEALLVSSIQLNGNWRLLKGNNTDEDGALKFLADYDREAKAMCTTVMNSQWDFNTNITDVSKERMVR